MLTHLHQLVSDPRVRFLLFCSVAVIFISQTSGSRLPAGVTTPVLAAFFYSTIARAFETSRQSPSEEDEEFES